MITNNKYRAMRKNVVSKEKIKSEDSSLRVENTSEDLRASISCIESNKLEQITTSIANGDEYDSPSINNPSPVKGVTGDVKLVVHNKNFISLGTFIEGYTRIESGVFNPSSYGKSYIFETKKLPDIITINGEVANRSNVSYYDEFPKINVQSKEYSAKNSMILPRKIEVNKTYKYILIQFGYEIELSNIQIDEGSESTEYVESKKQIYNVTLGTKTLYKGDKIIRKDGKWYLSLKWKILNDFSNLIRQITNTENICRWQVPFVCKITDSNNNLNGGFSNILSLVPEGQTYNKKIGFTTNNSNVYFYAEELSEMTVSQAKNKLIEIGAYFVLPIEDELEEITDETLMKQLDTILTCIIEYDDVTNFDFDNDVVFEINVEKDNIKLQRAEFKKEIENMKNEITTASVLALESEV